MEAAEQIIRLSYNTYSRALIASICDNLWSTWHFFRDYEFINYQIVYRRFSYTVSNSHFLMFHTQIYCKINISFLMFFN